ncbi:DUF4855 domain-containing protein [Salimicrobium halophilum]|uniref:S-layer homology domain-containing protein n=1 Tax=Salimicrobium halophilum TaxID=86666 RepID=A0A1G8S6F2_9BACI|nr:DUF4855 domain-containing protein [Salimicrobium halophilum]SDJ24250.1 S-layer homology domain-containing protein [Salimicrobium halophilum]
MKKIIMLVLTGILLGTGPVSAKESFTDVDFHHWAHDEIEFLSGKGIINGYSTGDFKPRAYITRKQAAIMLKRALGYEGDPVRAVLDENLFHEPYSAFRPYEALKRKDMARALAKAYNIEGNAHSHFPDVSEKHPYYKYVDAMNTFAITQGYGDGEFKPEVPVNRAQFATFMTRVFQTPFEYEVFKEGKSAGTFETRQEAIDAASDQEGAIVRPDMKAGALAQVSAPFDEGVLLYEGNYTPEQLKPYINYQEEDGSYAGDFFDTFIVLDRYNDAQKGYLEEDSNDLNYRDWQVFLNQAFSTSMLGSLNRAAGALGESREVYLMIPYPKDEGVIIGENNERITNTRTARASWVDWYVKKAESMWEKTGYDNLELKGFYWANETVISAEDELLVMDVSAELEARGHSFIYSPHAKTTNLKEWELYGFDGAYLQPNAFREHGKASAMKLHEIMQMVQMYGTNINIEIPSHKPAEYEEGVDNFNRYLDFLENYEVNDQSTLVYQDFQQIYRLAKDSYPGYRELYQKLYETLK